MQRGEEHSFILKPATSVWKSPKCHGGRSSQSSHLEAGSAASSLRFTYTFIYLTLLLINAAPREKEI
ncbi:unnamed protein product [Ilex paraguariensis]|uniref:Uncharacterized protein n=1 Tax=Ilex paraguariensis TaxID=185542 RepID=A0ABC8RMG6_9AQUA